MQNYKNIFKPGTIIISNIIFQAYLYQRHVYNQDFMQQTYIGHILCDDRPQVTHDSFNLCYCQGISY